MTELCATYRIQFRNGMTFERATKLVPYLAALGVSHLYASPIFRAAPGSTHGYDVVDYQALAPELGGEAGFQTLLQALRKHGLGMLLDIVPNHMAASTANPWWRDVLRHGRKSRYAGYFDVDWRAPRLLLPLLGEPYGRALEEGKFRIALEEGEAFFRYADQFLPLAPGSLEAAAGQTGTPAQLAAYINEDFARLHQLHEAQVWRLSYWRMAREALRYRRFFEIAELVGVRVEKAEVFQDVHALPLRLLQEGAVDFLRIDHIDGLCDPKGYLARLQEESGGAGVFVEKILAAGEELPGDWPCLGTSGYELARCITSLQVARQNAGAMLGVWRDFTGESGDGGTLLTGIKRHILTVNLASELSLLVSLASSLAAKALATRDFGPDSLRVALVELMAALPVYRTYIDARGPSERDRELLSAAAEAVMQGRMVEDDAIVKFLLSLLLRSPPATAEELTFIQRFQQTSGPLMAKAVEDTFFYRYNPLIALNEVGSEPGAFGQSGADFHAAMKQRAEIWPENLSATATHDTKRGEDARARLALLSEMPAEWGVAVEAWHRAAHSCDAEVASAIHPADAWLFYQALLGAWPACLRLEDEEGLQALAERLNTFMIKALREAKVRSSWTNPDQSYEAAVTAFVRFLFEPPRRPVLRKIRTWLVTLEPAALVNSLAQLTLKMTLPGVPDIYQGTEFHDHSLVDPDNRRAVDFARREACLAELRDLAAPQAMALWREDRTKFWLMARLLKFRAEWRDVFAQGSYEAATVAGSEARHVLAFRRVLAGRAEVVVAVPLQILHHLDTTSRSWLSGAFSTTSVRLGTGSFITLTGETVEGPDVPLSRLWACLPILVAARRQ